jgi:hypothetical protein
MPIDWMPRIFRRAPEAHDDGAAERRALDRRFTVLDEQLAWCTAMHSPREIVERLRAYLDEARQARDERARELVATIAGSAAAMLPRGRERTPELAAPRRDDDSYLFDNGSVQARFGDKGELLELTARGLENGVAHANLLSARRGRRILRTAPGQARVADHGLEVPFLIGDSPATLRVTLVGGEPFVRADLAVHWRERGARLVLENWFTVSAEPPWFGVSDAHLCALDDARAGIAVFALDTIGWSVRALPKGGAHVAHTLVSEPAAAVQRSWAFAPLHGATPGKIEAAWERFAYPPRVRLFTSDTPNVIVAACAPAPDGDGVVVTVRECEGRDAPLRLRCGARMRSAEPAEEVRIEAEELVAMIRAHATASFRVRFV